MKTVHRWGMTAALLLCAVASAEDGPVPVRAQPLATLLLYPELSAPARVESYNESRISAQLNARITALPVRVGEVIERGALLAELECTDFRLALEAAEARLSLARAQFERTRALADTQSLAREQLDVRTTEQDSARVERERAALEVGRCRITAPFDGVVTTRHASVGELASAGTPLVELLSLEDIEVVAQVPSERITSLVDSAERVFETAGRAHPLTIRTLMPTVDGATGTREVRLRPRGESAPPGTTGRLLWRSGQPHLPPDLPVSRDGQLGVFVLNSGTVRFVPIEGALEGRPAALPDTLSPDARVVTDGRQRLRDGDTVALVD